MFQPNDPDRDQDNQPGILTQQVGIIHGVLAVNHDGSWRHTRGSGTGFLGPTVEMDHQVDALPCDECGDMGDCCRWQMDLNNWFIPSSFHTGELTGLGRGPDTLPGSRSHRVTGPQCGPFALVDSAKLRVHSDSTSALYRIYPSSKSIKIQ